MVNRDENIKLFELIDLATEGNEKAKWEIIWRFNNLIIKNSFIKGKFNEGCQEFIEKRVFESIENFQTLKKLKKFKKF